MVSTSRSPEQYSTDWYQLVLTAGKQMPTWTPRAVFTIVEADDIYICLAGKGDTVDLRIFDENMMYGIQFFRVEKLMSGYIHYGFRFIPDLSRKDFNAWKDTVGGLFERAASNLDKATRSK